MQQSSYTLADESSKVILEEEDAAVCVVCIVLRGGVLGLRMDGGFAADDAGEDSSDGETPVMMPRDVLECDGVYQHC